MIYTEPRDGMLYFMEAYNSSPKTAFLQLGAWFPYWWRVKYSLMYNLPVKDPIVSFSMADGLNWKTGKDSTADYRMRIIRLEKLMPQFKMRGAQEDNVIEKVFLIHIRKVDKDREK